MRIWLLFLFIPGLAYADFSNYNSILLGSRASGMGGAFTSLAGDPDASPFYNPATLARLKGSSFSAGANIYNKYDTSFSNSGSISDSTLKINRGSFQGIPASAGSGFSFGNFALGISIITPDYDIFNGDLSFASLPNSTAFVNYKDQSLWVGGNFAVNFTEKLSWGFTAYYTSRDYQRSTTDQTVSATQTKFTYENKTFTANDVVYVLGLFYLLDRHWQTGLTWRPPSIQLSGAGSYYLSVLDTSSSNVPVITSRKDLNSHTDIPQRLALGLSYTEPQRWTVAADVTYHGSESFRDMDDPTAGDLIQYRQLLGFSIGGEYFVKSWAAVRAGVFTNFSSHPDVVGNGQRQGDHIDMLGFSANLCVYSGQTTFTFGGYFNGGRGQSTQEIGQQIVTVPKVQYVYSMLIGTSYAF